MKVDPKKSHSLLRARAIVGDKEDGSPAQAVEIVSSPDDEKTEKSICFTSFYGAILLLTDLGSELVKIALARLDDRLFQTALNDRQEKLLDCGCSMCKRVLGTIEVVRAAAEAERAKGNAVKVDETIH